MKGRWISLGMIGALLAAMPAWSAPAPRRPAPPRSTRSISPRSPVEPSRDLEPSDKIFRVIASPDGKTVYLIGILESGSFLKFARVMRGLPNIKTVSLGSPGGIVLEGYLIAAFVRDHKFNTYAEYLCASACTQILVAGADRAAAPTARIGFHRSAPVEDSPELDNDDFNRAPMPSGPGPRDGAPGANSATPKQGPGSNSGGSDKSAARPSAKGDGGSSVSDSNDDEDHDSLFRVAFVRTGVEQSFITHAFGTPHENMWYPSADVMIRARFLSRASRGNELAAAPGVGIARERFESLLGQQSLWRTARQYRVAAYGEAIAEGVRSSHSGSDEAEALINARASLMAELMKFLPTAPDEIVDGFAKLSADQSRADRIGGYPQCGSGSRSGSAPADPAYEARESALLEQLATPFKPVRAPSRNKAIRSAARVIGRAMGGHVGADDCQESSRMVESIGNLPRKDRIDAFRALIFLGQLADEEEAQQN